MRLGEFYHAFFLTIWAAWAVTWLVFSHNVKANIRRQAALPRILNVALLFCTFALLWAQQLPAPGLMERFLPGSQWPFWTTLGAGLTLIGLLFTVWARIFLGRNWSGVVTIKADHELVTGGPYGLVRHPIYSGLALAIVGTALAIGEWRGVLAVALAFIAFFQRILVEERFMRQQFGAAYDEYALRVRAFLPGVI